MNTQKYAQQSTLKVCMEDNMVYLVLYIEDGLFVNVATDLSDEDCVLLEEWHDIFRFNPVSNDVHLMTDGTWVEVAITDKVKLLTGLDK